MNVFTQLNKPSSLEDSDIWLPCLVTETVDHFSAWKQPLIVTHRAALDHYQHDLKPLLNQHVHCIGPKTYDQIVDMGFTNVHLHGFYADDIKMNQAPITPCTWLHGDRYRKDFSKFTGVTAIQTYKTSLQESSLDTVTRMITANELEHLWVYSDMVVQALESNKKLDRSKVKLFHTESCKPDNNWKMVKDFYPGQEEKPKAPL